MKRLGQSHNFIVRAGTSDAAEDRHPRGVVKDCRQAVEVRIRRADHRLRGHILRPRNASGGDSMAATSPDNTMTETPAVRRPACSAWHIVSRRGNCMGFAEMISQIVAGPL